MKPMTTIEMAERLEAQIIMLGWERDAIARRLRLLEAVADAANRYVYKSSRFEPENLFQSKLKQSVDALAKESPCSNESPGGWAKPVAPSGGTDAVTTTSRGCPVPTTATTATTTTAKSGTASHHSAPAAANESNPPPWATPDILAACEPGERLYGDEDFVVAFPSDRRWENGRQTEPVFPEHRYAQLWGNTLYTVPPKPAPECDGSGEINKRRTGYDHYQGGVEISDPCPGCQKCHRAKMVADAKEAKGIDDAEEVARKIAEMPIDEAIAYAVQEVPGCFVWVPDADEPRDLVVPPGRFTRAFWFDAAWEWVENRERESSGCYMPIRSACGYDVAGMDYPTKYHALAAACLLTKRTTKHLDPH